MLHSSPRAARILSAATLLLIPSLLRADYVSYYFVGPTNSLYSDPDNWSTSPNGPGGTPPGAYDNAYVSPSTPLIINVDGNPNNTYLNSASFNGQTNALLTVNQTGDLSATSIEIASNTVYSVTGSATLNGDFGVTISGASVYQSGGSITSYASRIQIGGDTAPTNYFLSSGSIHADDIDLGGAMPVSFTQTGGDVSTSYDIVVGRNASYSLSTGGVSPAGTLAVGFTNDTTSPNSGSTFSQTGGTVLFQPIYSTTSLVVDSVSNAHALYSLSGGTMQFNGLDAAIGYTHAGTFLQSGGTISGLTFLRLGFDSTATGTYLLSGGSLSATVAQLANQGSATFSQSGGVTSFTSFTLANTSSSSATLNLSGGNFTVLDSNPTPVNYIAYAGSATVNQTGGTLTVSPSDFGRITLASQPGSSATYNLSGGELDTYFLTIGDQGSASLNQTGGNLFAYSLTIGSAIAPSSFSQSGGSILVPTTGEFFLSSNSAASLSGTASLHVGYSQLNGAFTQSGGDHSIDSANIAGQYNLQSGTFGAGGLFLTGTFSQSGGTSSIFIYPGLQITGNGLYSLSAGTLSTQSVTIADAGKAYFLQTGGTHTTSQLAIAAQPSSTGIYDLLAGSLSANSITNAGTFYMQSPASLTFTGNSPTFTNTGSATLDGTQSWPANSIFSNTLVALFHSDPGSPTSSNLSFSSASPSWAPVLFDAPTLHFASINLSSTTHATLSPTSAYLYTRALTLTDSAELDLTTSTLLINDPSMSLDTLRQYLHDHHLLSTSSDSTHTIAYTTLSLLSPNSPQSTTAQSSGTGPATLLITLSLTGDINLDGKIDADDYALLDKNFAAQTPDPHWTDGDFNYDGIIDQNDYLLIDTAYAQNHVLSPSFFSSRESKFGPAYVSELLTSIPEPSLPLCLLAGLLFNHRLRSRRITL